MLVLVVGLANIAENVGGEGSVGVLPGRVLGDPDARDAQVALLEIGHGGEVEVAHVMIREIGIGAEMFPDILRVERRGQAQGVLDRIDALPDDFDDVVLGPLFAALGRFKLKLGHIALVALGVGAAQIAEVKVDVEAGPVLGQHDAVAVADRTAGRGQADLDRRLLLRLSVGRIGIDDLHVPEAAQEHPDGGKDDQRQYAQPPALDANIVSEHSFSPGVRGSASSRRGGEGGPTR